MSEKQRCLDTRLLFLKHKWKALSSFVIYFSIFIIVPLRSPTYILAFKPKLRDVASSYDELSLVVVAVLAKQSIVDGSQWTLSTIFLFLFLFSALHILLSWRDDDGGRLWHVGSLSTSIMILESCERRCLQWIERWSRNKLSYCEATKRKQEGITEAGWNRARSA